MVRPYWSPGVHTGCFPTGYGLLSGLLFFYILTAAAPAKAASLTILYFERPPYYYTTESGPRGLLIELTRSILQQAGIEADFSSQPPGRILKSIEESGEPLCAVGWFKTEARQEFASFTLPFFRNAPLVLLTSRHLAEKFSRHRTIEEVFGDPTLTLGKVAAFSYGDHLDELMAELEPSIIEVSCRQAALPRMILKDRIDYMLVAPEELELLLRSAEVDAASFMSIQVAGIPAGADRHFMCSKATGEALISRLDSVITTRLSTDN